MVEREKKDVMKTHLDSTHDNSKADSRATVASTQISHAYNDDDTHGPVLLLHFQCPFVSLCENKNKKCMLFFISKWYKSTSFLALTGFVSGSPPVFFHLLQPFQIRTSCYYAKQNDFPKMK